MSELCAWCHEREAVVDDECVFCSRLPGHSHEGEDERDDEIARLQALINHILMIAESGCQYEQEAFDKLREIETAINDAIIEKSKQ